ncbi:1,2-phenylacetyl-CoA epoxidase subunit PaaC [Streptomyces tendae]|uniref:1,2-phenylacetyl-CoA epoxidase subunit PaaC n=1 Tax=Streptomyces tendae TaxID=1932 RepID=UPI003697C5DC
MTDPVAPGPPVAAHAVGPDLAAYALRLGDDALILAQRLCEWVTRAPTIEEDLALSNIALDLIGQARTLLTTAGRYDGGRDEDDLAYGRTAQEFRNALLVELPNGDFAVTIARQLAYTQYAFLLHTALRESADPELAAYATRAAQETEYHLMYAGRWTAQLAGGTEESRRRLRAGLEQIWPFTAELFEEDDLVRRLAADGTIVSPATLRETWERRLTATLGAQGLALPVPAEQRTGGRRGEHTEYFEDLVAELQELRRAYPGGIW